MNSIQDILGLKDGMSTYFAHAPSEYFDLLNLRTYTHRPDDDGTYDFMHAFFIDRDQLVASLGILTSKLGNDGIFWLSWPTNQNTDIAFQDVAQMAKQLGFKLTKKTNCIPNWETHLLSIN